MDKTYDPHQLERQWYKTWEEKGYFAPSGEGEPYCIMIPPPNVTGNLHMGHGFQDSLMDALIRYQRMCGKNTHWQVGTDHAGIATQMVVERQLLAQGKTRHDLGRDAFIDRVWEWKKESGGNITQQMRRIGCSVDWAQERFTMDAGLSHAVTAVFERLYDEGLIYRGKRLVNWDPKLHTAVSDLEAISHEEQGHLWYFRYPLVDSNEHVVIATTRPETMLGDTAVAVNPKDARYQHLVGKQVQLPLTGRTIPIIADDYVDPEFGTGCVKITPAHDFNDYEVGKRHDLPMINILTTTAQINENGPEPYRGLDRFTARQRIVDDMKIAGLLEKVAEHSLKIPRGDRSGDVLEPYLTTQWYVKAKPLAEPAIAAVENGDIKFVPENWSRTYFQWMHNIEDWCISRQLWWGHRIPAWYDRDNNVYVGQDEAAIRTKYKLADDVKLHQDEDVLDTWFSSALWPFSTLGWPQETDAYKIFYPTHVLVTGFDIIFYWVARMIMMGLKFTGKIPFDTVYITGLIRDSKGQKMSKSKGNVLDPIDLIDGVDLETLVKKRTASLMQTHIADEVEIATRAEFPEGIPSFGTDALRFTYCALAATGRDIRFDLGRLDGYRNFCNKIWNAARYVLMNTEDQDTGLTNQDMEFSVADRWILSLLQDTIEKAHGYFNSYRFDLLAQSLYDFIWNEYCDWYLELSKPVLMSDDSSDAQKRATRYTLVHILEALQRLLHPLMPYITEAIWQRVAPLAGAKGDTIMLQNYPQVDKANIDAEASADIAWLKQVIIGVRNIRGEMNIAPSKPLPVLFHKGSAEDKQRLDNTRTVLSKLARLDNITWVEAGDKLPAAATALVGDMELLIPMAGLIDVAAENARLNKELDKLQKDLTRSQGKLSNPKFIDKAPAVVVAKEKAIVEELQTAIDKLQERLKLLEDLS